MVMKIIDSKTSISTYFAHSVLEVLQGPDQPAGPEHMIGRSNFGATSIIAPLSISNCCNMTNGMTIEVQELAKLSSPSVDGMRIISGLYDDPVDLSFLVTRLR
jgi:hypothetical protein